MKNDGLTIYAAASIICGTLSWFALAIILAPLGIIFGAIAVKSENGATKALSIIGIIISAIMLVIYVFSLMLLASMK